MLKCPRCHNELDRIYSTGTHTITKEYWLNKNDKLYCHQYNVDGEYNEHELIECYYCGTDITCCFDKETLPNISEE